MTFAKYFKASTYCLVTAGFVAIAATGSMDLVSLVLFSSALAVSWFIDTVRLHQRIPTWVLNCVALAYFLFLPADYKLLSHSFVISTIHLMFFMAAVKLLTLSRDRDYVYLYLISFAEFLAASTLTIDLTFAVFFFVFLLSGISTLVLFEMRRSSATTLARGKVQPLVVPKSLQGTGLELFSPFPAGTVAGMVLGMTLLTLAVSVPLFFLLPRIALGLYNRPSGPTQLMSGFSDRVELGQIGTIKESDTVVMRVRLSEPPSDLPANLKWRGIALDHYDGRSWSRSDPRRHTVPPQVRYYKLEESTQGTDLLVQTYFMEAMSTTVVFASHKVLAVSSDIGLLQRDSADNLYTAQHLLKKLRYEAVSDPIQPDPANISRLEPIPPDIRNTCLQLPLEDPRVANLAREVTKMATSPYAKAQAVERYLRTHYAYSLDLRGTPNSKDPLAMFLFDVRKGHCEYFASAMTIMLRQLGIPARLVNGFRSGEYNSIGDSWTVRQYNAHSWVEAYFPPYAWIEFDPTPADPQHLRPAFTRMLSNLIDAIDLWWWEGVVNYDFWKQSQLISAIRSRLADLQNSLKSVLFFAHKRALAAASAARFQSLRSALSYDWFYWILPLIVAASPLLIKSWRKRISRSIRQAIYRNDQAAVISCFYADALDLLRSYGMRRGRSQTPLEFAETLGDHPAATSLTALTHIYYRFRFGCPGSRIPSAQAETLLRSLRQALQKGRHP